MAVVERLANGEDLEPKYRDHSLTGNYVGCRECHVEPDWLLIYQKHEDVLICFCIGRAVMPSFSPNRT